MTYYRINNEIFNTQLLTFLVIIVFCLMNQTHLERENQKRRFIHLTTKVVKFGNFLTEIALNVITKVYNMSKENSSTDNLWKHQKKCQTNETLINTVAPAIATNYTVDEMSELFVNWICVNMHAFIYEQLNSKVFFSVDLWTQL